MVKIFLYRFFIFLTVYLFLGPIFTFLHEIGHAIIPLIYKEDVQIYMGVDSFSLFSFTLGNLQIIWNNTIFPWVGYTRYHNEFIFALLLGPVISLLLFVLIRFYITKRSKITFVSQIVHASSYWCLFQGFFTLVPLEYPIWLHGYENFSSDGMVFLKMIVN